MTKRRRIPRLRITGRQTLTAHLAFTWVTEAIWDQDGFIATWEGVYPTWHSAIHDLPNVAASVFTRRTIIS